MNKLPFLLIAGFAVAAGCASEPNPSASGVFPSQGFIGRTMRVEVTGDVTTWKDGAAVDFGTGITVSKVTVASPTTVFADIAIDPTTAPGLHDVTITSGSQKLTLKQAFELQPAVSIHWKGLAAQGSVAFFTISNKDFSTPFDTTSTGDGFFTPLVYTNLSFTTPSGVTMNVDSATEYSLSGTAFFDLDAAPGPVALVSGAAGAADAITSSTGEDVAVMARTPTPLMSGTPVTVSVANGYDSQLYSLDAATAPTLVRLNVTSGNPDASPGVALLPSSGRWADLLKYSAKPYAVSNTANDKFYAVYIDTTGTSGYSYILRPNVQTMGTVADTEPGNNTAAGAVVAASVPTLLSGATLASGTDEDWVKVTTGASDGGKKIHVVTFGSDQLTDTVVDVLSANGATSLGGPSSDQGYHEDFLSSAVAASTTYTVKVSASSMFDPSHSAYNAAIWVE